MPVISDETLLFFLSQFNKTKSNILDNPNNQICNLIIPNYGSIGQIFYTCNDTKYYITFNVDNGKITFNAFKDGTDLKDIKINYIYVFGKCIQFSFQMTYYENDTVIDDRIEYSEDDTLTLIESVKDPHIREYAIYVHKYSSQVETISVDVYPDDEDDTKVAAKLNIITDAKKLRNGYLEYYEYDDNYNQVGVCYIWFNQDSTNYYHINSDGIKESLYPYEFIKRYPKANRIYLKYVSIMDQIATDKKIIKTGLSLDGVSPVPAHEQEYDRRVKTGNNILGSAYKFFQGGN